MKEGAKPLAQLHAERKLFVERAMQEGALEGMNRKKVDIGLMYTFNDELTLDDIATQVYPEDKSGKANTSSHYREFMTILLRRVSHTLGSQYNEKGLLARKPTSQESRKRYSESHGGGALGIRDLILRGARSVDELKKQSDLSRGSIRSSLKTLEGWGIDVSQFASTIRKNKEKIEQLIKEEDDKKIQRIFDELSSRVIIDNLNEHKKRKKRRNPRVFTTIGRTISGMYRYKFTETYLFMQDLEDNGIPNRRIEEYRKGKKLFYYVLLEKHKERALAVWDKDPRLGRFKTNLVSIFCGRTNADVPSTTQLFHGENYRSVSSVLLDLRIQVHPRQQREFRKWLFEGCPITVWECRKGRYISASDIDLFKQYFLQKLT